MFEHEPCFDRLRTVLWLVDLGQTFNIDNWFQVVTMTRSALYHSGWPLYCYAKHNSHLSLFVGYKYLGLLASGQSLLEFRKESIVVVAEALCCQVLLKLFWVNVTRISEFGFESKIQTGTSQLNNYPCFSAKFLFIYFSHSQREKKRKQIRSYH